MNKVIDYMAPIDIARLFGLVNYTNISNSAKKGEINGAYKFGRSWAIPISWVKNECRNRGIYFVGIELEEDEIGVRVGVSLDDFYTINEVVEMTGEKLGTIMWELETGVIPESVHVVYYNTRGIKKDYIKLRYGDDVIEIK